ncbi:MAG: FkbM family methyltransferase [Flavobacterium sp.]|uniref:FkbM family methyltransferase n=1 Tax=Flavobacterium sp. TaxID=239 RepID=UPI0012061284|nr:FkbM family methyltransferase [Flavobacterium sp.]RZJ66924.1 MAG: FkbM family methyltransferase [Flavobacterium sp.]
MSESKKVVYDVGMHRGEDTDFYLKKGFKVIAFEADPDLAESCRKRFSEHLKSNQLTIVEGAIVDMERYKGQDKIRFFKNTVTSVWGTVVDDWAERNNKLGAQSEIIEVPIVDFSECLKTHGIPYYLKIDIEGMDVICLKALRNFVERPEYISIESEKVSFEKLTEEFNIFKELGYDTFQIVNQTKITSNREPRNSSEGSFADYKFLKGATGLFGTDLKRNAWQSHEKSMSRYRTIFKGYRLLGDDAPVNKFFLGRVVSKSMNRLFGIPGWYDTHAKHSSVKS